MVEPWRVEPKSPSSRREPDLANRQRLHRTHLLDLASPSTPTIQTQTVAATSSLMSDSVATPSRTARSIARSGTRSEI
jgi:hypothetical protein